jgi:hypothetical protein
MRRHYGLAKIADNKFFQISKKLHDDGLVEAHGDACFFIDFQRSMITDGGQNGVNSHKAANNKGDCSEAKKRQNQRANKGQEPPQQKSTVLYLCRHINDIADPPSCRNACDHFSPVSTYGHLAASCVTRRKVASDGAMSRVFRI